MLLSLYPVDLGCRTRAQSPQACNRVQAMYMLHSFSLVAWGREPNAVERES